MAARDQSGVIAIFGPTASGKTDAAEALADRLPAELVSVDAMQVYRGLPILTNQSARPSHLVAAWPLHHGGSVGEFERLAHTAIDGIIRRGRTPVVVGGTGLYLRTALADLRIPPAPPAELRERVETMYDRLGPAASHAMLAERDPAAAAAVHPNDRRRVVRGLELAELGASLRPADQRLWHEQTRHPTVIVGLDLPVDELDRRIALRTRAMFERGVEEEVRRAVADGHVSRTAWAIHGLREIAELPGDEAHAELVRITRRYARYQRKWMRRIPGLVTVRADRPAGEVADEILEVASARQLLPRRRAG
jgi:tRNA dimethylallyltransferase